MHLRDLLPSADGTDLPPPADRTYFRPPVDAAVTRNSVVSLREITKDNLRAVMCADVAGAQRRFVAPNSVSLAQAYLAGDAWHRAIYADDTVVGFAMAAVMLEDELGLSLKGDPDLWRFMIDHRYQGLGFGARSLELIVAELRAWEGARNVWLSCVRGAGSPYGLYTNFGFEDTGVVSDGEVILQLALS